MATADECVAEFLVTHRDHINGQDTEQQYEATKSIREKLSMLGGRMTQDIFISGLVPRFVEFLRKESAPPLQHEAIQLVFHLVQWGPPDQIDAMVNLGLVSLLIDMLFSTENRATLAFAISALAHLNRVSVTHRDLVVSLGGIAAIVQGVTRLCSGSQQNDDLKQEGLNTLMDLLCDEDIDQGAWVDVCSAFATIMEDPQTSILVHVHRSIANCLIRRLHPDASVNVLRPVVRAIGNLLQGGDDLTSMLTNAKVAPALKALMTHFDAEIRRDVFWSISNITAGTQLQIQVIIDADIFPHLIGLLSLSAPVTGQQEALWAISNVAALGKPQQKLYILSKQDVIPTLCTYLLQTREEPSLLVSTLEALEILWSAANDMKRGKDVYRLVRQHGGDALVTLLEAYGSDDDNGSRQNVARTLLAYIAEYDDQE